MLNEKDIKHIEELSDLSNTTLTLDQAYYRLGCIYGIIYKCKSIEPARAKEKIEKSIDEAINKIFEASKNDIMQPIVVASESIEEPKQLSFGDLAAAELDKRDMTSEKDSDEKLISLLGRKADHTSLKGEIAHRWLNKNYANQIYKHLSADNIITISDFVLYFDNPDNFKKLEEASLFQRDDDDQFHYSHYSKSDLTKLRDMYVAVNEGMIGTNNASADDILKEFLDIGRQLRASRYITALKSVYSIYTINQLYYFVEHKGIDELKKGKYLGNVPASIYKIKDKRFAKEA